jgi:hypothetical protein
MFRILPPENIPEIPVRFTRQPLLKIAKLLPKSRILHPVNSVLIIAKRQHNQLAKYHGTREFPCVPSSNSRHLSSPYTVARLAIQSSRQIDLFGIAKDHPDFSLFFVPARHQTPNITPEFKDKKKKKRIIELEHKPRSATPSSSSEQTQSRIMSTNKVESLAGVRFHRAEERA